MPVICVRPVTVPPSAGVLMIAVGASWSPAARSATVKVACPTAPPKVARIPVTADVQRAPDPRGGDAGDARRARGPVGCDRGAGAVDVDGGGLERDLLAGDAQGAGRRDPDLGDDALGAVAVLVDAVVGDLGQVGAEGRVGVVAVALIGREAVAVGVGVERAGAERDGELHARATQDLALGGRLLRQNLAGRGERRQLDLRRQGEIAAQNRIHRRAAGLTDDVGHDARLLGEEVSLLCPVARSPRTRPPYRT